MAQGNATLRVSPTNRGETGARNTTPGLDTVGVAFPITSDFERRGASAQVEGLGTPAESWRYRHKLPGGGFVALGVGTKAWVEASLPKRVGPDNVFALPVPEALQVLESAVGEATQFCTPDRARDGHRLELAKLVRLDAARDFDGVSLIPAVLDGLATVPGRDARMKVKRFQDAERNRAESLRVGPKAWGAQLYDKNAETASAPEGRLRFEPRMHAEQLMSEWAKHQGVVMRQVGDLTQEKVTALSRAVFQRVGFDREVSGVAEAASLVFGLPIKPAQRAMLWSFLTAPGFAASMDRHARYRYRDLAASLGLVVGQVLDAGALPFTVRLDFETGREVFRAA